MIRENRSGRILSRVPVSLWSLRSHMSGNSPPILRVLKKLDSNE